MSPLLDKLNNFHTGLATTKVARKYKFLTENAFRFFRGTNNLFMEDLIVADIPHSPVSWICGDLHIENFGSYKGATGLVYFDVNDFDESVLGPVAWDLARLVTSLFVAFDALKITDRDIIRTCEVLIAKYAKVLASGKPKYIETRTAKAIVRRFLDTVQNRTQKELLKGRTIKRKKKKLRLDHTAEKHLSLDPALKEELIKAIKHWMKCNNKPPNNYKVLDVNFRLAGTGSVGVQRYIFLLEKATEKGKYMLIDMKEATPSCLEGMVAIEQPVWECEAERITTIQTIMQNVPPAQLSTFHFKDRSFVMQQLQPTKDQINFEMIQDELDEVFNVVEDMAILTASAHLRGVGRKGSCTADELIAFGKQKDWQAKLLQFCLEEKDKVFKDFKNFRNEMRALKRRKKMTYKIGIAN